MTDLNQCAFAAGPTKSVPRGDLMYETASFVFVGSVVSKHNVWRCSHQPADIPKRDHQHLQELYEPVAYPGGGGGGGCFGCSSTLLNDRIQWNPSLRTPLKCGLTL